METLTHECYVPLEVAKLLKEAGFDWETRASYWFDSTIAKDYILTHSVTHDNWNAVKDDDIDYLSAPTLDVAQRWLREVKAIHICVKPNEASANCKYFVTVIVNDTKWGNIQDNNRKTIMFDTYEEAQEAGIKKVLEIILKN